MNIKTLLFISALCIAQSNFGMDLPNDGQEWTHIKSEEDVKLFAGKLVACTSTPYKIDLNRLKENDQIGYGLMSESTKYCPTYNECAYSIDNSKKWDFKSEQSLHNKFLEQNIISMRLLTLKEARSIIASKQFFVPYKKIISPLFHFIKEQSLIDDKYFKLNHLTPKEQRHYIHNQLQPNTLTLRLTHKFRKEESPLATLPKEILNMIITRLIDMQVKKNQATILDLQIR